MSKPERRSLLRGWRDRQPPTVYRAQVRPVLTALGFWAIISALVIAFAILIGGQ